MKNDQDLNQSATKNVATHSVSPNNKNTLLKGVLMPASIVDLKAINGKLAKNATSNNEPQNKKWVKPVKQALLNGALIPPAVTVLEAISAKAQTEPHISTSGQKGIFAIPFSLMTNWQPLLHAYLASTGQSVAKSALITQSPILHEKVSKQIGKSNQSNPKKTLDDKIQTELHGLTPAQKIIANAITAAAISVPDTALSLPLSNYKAMKALQPNAKLSISDITKNPNFLKYGWQAKWASSLSNIGPHVVAGTVIEPELEKVFPKEKYGQTSTLLTVALSGSLAGLARNPSDRIYNTAIKQVSPDFKGPKLRHVARDILEKEGLKAFWKGSKWTVLTTLVGHGITKAVEKYVNREPADAKSPGGLSIFAQGNQPAGVDKPYEEDLKQAYTHATL